MTTSTVIETPRIERWLFSKLDADATIDSNIGNRIYTHPAPQGATLPFITMELVVPGETRSVGSYRVFARSLYRVTAWDQVDSRQGTIKTLADRILAVLHQASGTVVDGAVTATIQSCVTEAPFSRSETSEGVRYERLGWDFRIKASVA